MKFTKIFSAENSPIALQKEVEVYESKNLHNGIEPIMCSAVTCHRVNIVGHNTDVFFIAVTYNQFIPAKKA